MPFKAGSIVGDITLNMNGWSANIAKAKADAASVTGGLARMKESSVATTVAMETLGRTAAGSTAISLGRIGTTALQAVTAQAALRSAAVATTRALNEQAVAAARAADVQARKATMGFGTLIGGSREAAARSSASTAEAAAIGAVSARYTALAGAAAKASIGVGAVALAAYGTYKAFAPMVRESIAFEDSFTGIYKTVDATASQFRQLSDDIRGMSKEIPKSVHDLNSIGEIAGQLGVKTKNIQEYIRVISGVGTATTLGIEEAAAGFAKLENILNFPQEKTENLANAVIKLGNSSSATEPQIMDMSIRIAGAARIARMGADDVIALATSLTDVGMEPEAGGSSISRIIYDMVSAVERGTPKLKLFGALTNQTGEQFAAAFRASSRSALMAVIYGLGELQKSGGNTAQVMQELGIDNIRTMQAMSGLTGRVDQVRSNFDEATKAIATNTAFIQETTRAYGTTSAQMMILDNKIRDLKQSIGDDMKPAFVTFLSFASACVDALDKIYIGASNAAGVFGSISKNVNPASGILGGIVTGVSAWWSGKTTDLVKNYLVDLIQEQFSAGLKSFITPKAASSGEKGDAKKWMDDINAAISQMDKGAKKAKDSVADLGSELERLQQQGRDTFQRLNPDTGIVEKSISEIVGLRANDQFDTIQADKLAAEIAGQFKDLTQNELQSAVAMFNALGESDFGTRIADQIQLIRDGFADLGMTEAEFTEKFAMPDIEFKMPENSNAFGFSEGTLENLGSAASIIGSIGDLLGSLGPKFRKAGIAAQAAAQIIQIAMTATNWVVAAVQIAVTALTAAFSIFGDEGEKELTGMAKVIDEIKEASKEWVDQITDAFLEFTKTGTAAWQELAQTILDDLYRIAVSELIVNPLVQGAGDILGLAKGGAFVNGNIVPMAHGGYITNGPEIVAMASGALSLRGEAGNEAVLPLKRLGNGNLGVGGSLAPVNVIVNDHRASGEAVEVQETNVGGQRQIQIFIRDQVATMINSGTLDRTLARRYGIPARAY